MYSSSWQVFNHDGKRKYTDEAEFRRFLAATKLLPPPQRAFCQLVAYTGCRPSEARALNRAWWALMARRMRARSTSPISPACPIS